MTRQICRVCGNEVLSNGTLPLEFCTNCGTRLPQQAPGYAPDYGGAAFRRGKGGAKLTGREKFAFGVLISIPIILIIAGIGAVGLLIHNVSKKQRELGRYPNPRPYNSPSPQKPSNLLVSFGKDGLGQGEFKDAESLAVDKQGNIYVGDGTLRIQKFDPNGKFLQLWNITESTVKANDKYSTKVTHLAVDGKNRVYAAVDQKELLRYDGATGKFIDKITIKGEKSATYQPALRILDMVVLNDDNIAILADGFPDTLYVLLVSPEGKSEVKHKDLMKKQDSSNEGMMYGSLLVSVTGEMFLMNNMTGLDKAFIYRFKPDGSYVDRFTWGGAPMSPIFSNKIIALSSKGEIYVHNVYKSVITVLNIEGVTQRNIGLNSVYVEKLVLDANDNIFVLNRNQIEKYSSAGV